MKLNKKTPIMSVDIDGSKVWILDGKYHREDGPAIQWLNGSEEWLFEDQFHRVGGPAVENINGDKAWYIHGKLHREDGPAIENADGYKGWYINGEKSTEEEVMSRWNAKHEKEQLEETINHSEIEAKKLKL
jgi:hypothetical protein